MRGKRSVNTLERTKSMVYVALFAALTAVLSQISIPMPAGIPLTLQTFAIAFAGFYLGFGKGLQCVFVYVLLGVCGVPVFASFTGGAAKLVGGYGAVRRRDGHEPFRRRACGVRALRRKGPALRPARLGARAHGEIKALGGMRRPRPCGTLRPRARKIVEKITPRGT